MTLDSLEIQVVAATRRLLEWTGLSFICIMAYAHPWLKLTGMAVILTVVTYRLCRKKWPLSLVFFILGGVSNLLAVVFNEGKMPEVGQPPDATHQLLTASSHLPSLCDLYITGSGWLYGSYSVGDALIMIVFPTAMILEYFYFKSRAMKRGSDKRIAESLSGNVKGKITADVRDMVGKLELNATRPDDFFMLRELYRVFVGRTYSGGGRIIIYDKTGKKVEDWLSTVADECNCKGKVHSKVCIEQWKKENKESKKGG